MTKSRVLLADDQALLRHGLQMMVDAQPDLQVVGQAADGAEAVELAAWLSGVLGRGDEELARRVESVGVPPGREHALAGDELDVLPLAHAEADPELSTHKPRIASSA
jgi:DNA-binding NarL/FixJ family response regulator